MFGQTSIESYLDIMFWFPEECAYKNPSFHQPVPTLPAVCHLTLQCGRIRDTANVTVRRSLTLICGDFARRAIGKTGQDYQLVVTVLPLLIAWLQYYRRK